MCPRILLKAARRAARQHRRRLHQPLLRAALLLRRPADRGGALVAATAYVDLNPVRAKLAKRIEDIRDTSIHDRLLVNNAVALEDYLRPVLSASIPGPRTCRQAWPWWSDRPSPRRRIRPSRGKPGNYQSALTRPTRMSRSRTRKRQCDAGPAGSTRKSAPIPSLTAHSGRAQRVGGPDPARTGSA